MINLGDHYSYQEGTFNFTWYPASGKVRGSTLHNTHKCIEYFCSRGFEIDWFKSRIQNLILYVTLPENLTEDGKVDLLRKSKDVLLHTSEEAKVRKREDIILGNVDNSTGDVLKEKTIRNRLTILLNNTKITREEVVEYFNKFNLHEAKDAIPYMTASTRSKKAILTQGKRMLWELFEKGELRKLTEDEYLAKMNS